MASEQAILARFREQKARFQDIKEELDRTKNKVLPQYHEHLSTETIRKSADLTKTANELRALNVRVIGLLKACQIEEKLRECRELLDNEDNDLTVKMKTRAKDRRKKEREEMYDYMDGTDEDEITKRTKRMSVGNGTAQEGTTSQQGQ